MASSDDQTRETVLIGGGTYRRGTPPAGVPALRSRYGVRFPGSFESETPDHTVTVSSFVIDRYPVTNERFAAFVAAYPQWGPAQLPPTRHNGRYLAHWIDGTYPPALARHPVVFVTWQAAQCFCRWAGGRLPTEAEWEYAAGGAVGSEFPWGEALPSPELANYGAGNLGTTTPVGAYPPNALGLYDMAGNVWEWLLDEWTPVYTAEPQNDPIAGGRVEDGDVAGIEGRRVIRGGSFAGGVVNLRTRWRDSHLVSNAVEFVGFRCVYPVPSPPQ